MNEEIKSLLEYLHFNVYETTNWITPLSLDDKTWKILLNYITNLQEENQKLNKIIDELEKWLKDNIEYGDDDYYDMKAMGVESALNKLTELKKNLFKEKI